jgi:hypothetical protein
MARQRADIPAYEINRLAGELFVDPRSLKRWLAGEQVSPLLDARLRAGARQIDREDLVERVDWRLAQRAVGGTQVGAPCERPVGKGARD